ncbi:MAG: PC4/YdbC family ssDNA-binding protein [Coriobacteriales bacterium]|nr:PC4/YdbC family ssDNA-binding protein [Coriobacteriales bacterium]
MPDISYEIVESLGKKKKKSSGWTKELNLISWNGADPKYDLRDWAPNHDRMGKGVTLTNDEIQKLSALLNEKLK